VLFCSIKEFQKRTPFDDKTAAAIAVFSLFTIPVLYCTVADLSASVRRLVVRLRKLTKAKASPSE